MKNPPENPLKPSTLGGKLTIYFLLMVLIVGGAFLAYPIGNGWHHTVIPTLVLGMVAALFLAVTKGIDAMTAGISDRLNQVFMSVWLLGFGFWNLLGGVFMPGLSFWLEDEDRMAFGTFIQSWADISILKWVIASIFIPWGVGRLFPSKRSKDTVWVAAMLGIASSGTAMISVYYLLPDKVIFTDSQEFGLGLAFLSVVLLVVGYSSKLWLGLSERVMAASAVLPVAMSIHAFQADGTLGLAFLGISMAVSLPMMLLSMRRLFAAGTISDVKISTDPSPAKIGHHIHLNVSFMPKKDLVLTRVQADLTCTEGYSGNPASDEGSEYTEVTRLRLVGGYTQTLKKGTPFQCKLNCPIPEGENPTTRGSNPSYTWRMHVLIKIDGAPDWEDEFVVIVE